MHHVKPTHFGLALCLALVWPASASGDGVGSGNGAVAAGPLEPSRLTPPLQEMKVRWDGKESTAGGMKTFDSPRFGLTRDGGARAHAGIDLDAPVGTPIFAVADGVIDLARYGDATLGTDLLLMFRPTAPLLTYLARIGQGDDDGVLFAHYAHLSAVFVAPGQRVAGGTMIGRTGASGNADQKYPHLHFEIRKTRWPGAGAEGLRHRIDPELLFQVDFATPVEAATRASGSR
jgi:murein DD-endopeptidase MepM/ murein hydrolase activator NlpD